jgi:hypothetical protein
VTSAAPEEVRGWLGADHEADEITIVSNGQRGETLSVPQDHSIVAGWWD